MNQSRSGPRALIALLGVVAIIAAACGGSAASTAPSAAPSRGRRPVGAVTPEPTPLLTPEPIDASVPGPNGGQIIRWFVGLGAGGQPQQIQVQKDFVTAFNNDPANKDKAYISLEILDNNVAANILKTQIAAGNAPDIIGPVGVEGLNLFIDQVADLQPLHRVDRVRHEQVPRGPGQLLQDRQGRRHDRRAVRDLPVLPLVQQEAVRRGRPAVPADQGR